ncbi:MAG: hypothetical protein OXN27_08895 [Candidatus Poribacteria bacterium]|nr:hypothetical protein [Candidatus Poribacteria bacterium]MDE0324029.1 hypothetical protein [Candidatus Poribacteria bacterium]
MNLKFANLFLIVLIALVALAGCDRGQRVMMDSMPSADTTMGDAMTDIEAIPVKFVLLIDYPEGGKDAYIAWVTSVVPALQAPEEVVRIRSYDNEDPEMSPNRLVEWEFNSFLDMATYLNRPEIAAILGDIPNHTSVTTAHTFIQRSDYSKGEGGNWQIKGILLIDYPLGGKQAYLEWVASVSQALVAPPQLKATASYDNYYGESPHRLVELEFASREDIETYEQLETIMAIEAELDNQAGSWVLHTFELRSDYINE